MKWLLTITIVGYLACPALVMASTTRVQLGTAQIQSGITVTHDTGTVSLGIPAQALHHTTQATIKLRPVADPTQYPHTKGELLSDIYRYSITGNSQLKLKQAIWLQMSYPSAQANTRKVLKYWNTSLNKWQRVHRIKDFSDQWFMRGTLRHRHAVIAVFSKPIPVTTTDQAIVQGIASWYDGVGIASNDFPMGSVVRVTNVATGAYVDDTVVSTGPFVPGRVVDLTRAGFSAIADLSAGIVEVTVQLAPQ